jgi:metallo-beta-lactamase class B
VILGTDTLVAIATPGHTRGCTTWAMTVRDAGAARAMLFSCSLSIPGYQLRDDPPYPGIVQDYRTSIRRLLALPCDVLVAPHGSQFGLAVKAARARASATSSPFSDPEGCRAYLTQAGQDLEAELSGPTTP